MVARVKLNPDTSGAQDADFKEKKLTTEDTEGAEKRDRIGEAKNR
jgi:hypothetical protein